jgi:hypothetical protein
VSGFSGASSCDGFGTVVAADTSAIAGENHGSGVALSGGCIAAQLRI